MMGFRSRNALDHALKGRMLFLRPPLWVRIRRWIRRNVIGCVK